MIHISNVLCAWVCKAEHACLMILVQLRCVFIDDFITGNHCVAEDNFLFTIFLKRTIKLFYCYYHCPIQLQCYIMGKYHPLGVVIKIIRLISNFTDVFMALRAMLENSKKTKTLERPLVNTFMSH